MAIDWRWCKMCTFPVPPDAWHCTRCKACIKARHHHCILGICVTRYNTELFLSCAAIFIIVASVNLIYWTPIALTTFTFTSIWKATGNLVLIVIVMGIMFKLINFIQGEPRLCPHSETNFPRQFFNERVPLTLPSSGTRLLIGSRDITSQKREQLRLLFSPHVSEEVVSSTDEVREPPHVVVILISGTQPLIDRLTT